MRKLLILAASLGTLACGSDKWLDVPMMGCKDIENEGEIEQMFKQMIGPGVCRQAGALNYAGKYRCEDDKVQVLCEEP